MRLTRSIALRRLSRLGGTAVGLSMALGSCGPRPEKLEGRSPIARSVSITVAATGDRDSTTRRQIVAALEQQAPLPGMQGWTLARVTVDATGDLEPPLRAFSIPDEARIVVPLALIAQASAGTLTRIMRHELAHMALFHITQPRLVPAWFAEGYALWADGSYGCESKGRIYVSAVTRTVGSDLSFTSPATHGSVNLRNDIYASAVDFLLGRLDDDGISRFLKRISRVGFYDALFEESGYSEVALEDAWREDLIRSVAWDELENDCS